VSGSEKLTPLDKCRVAEVLEPETVFDISLVIEVIVDGCMNRGELL